MSHARGLATRLSRVARKAKFPEPDQADASCPVPLCKNISLRAWPKSTLYPLPSRPTEGQSIHVDRGGFINFFKVLYGETGSGFPIVSPTGFQPAALLDGRVP